MKNRHAVSGRRVRDVRGRPFFFQAEDGIRDHCVTGVQTCALPISGDRPPPDVRDAIDQLEAIVRDVAEELAGWRSRAQKAEAELKARGSPVKNADLESENKALRQRVRSEERRVGKECRSRWARYQ